jgi:hypothetical protein
MQTNISVPFKLRCSIEDDEDNYSGTSSGGGNPILTQARTLQLSNSTR